MRLGVDHEDVTQAEVIGRVLVGVERAQLDNDPKGSRPGCCPEVRGQLDRRVALEEELGGMLALAPEGIEAFVDSVKRIGRHPTR